MANTEHIEVLKRGVSAWNKWRWANPAVLPDLTGANLAGVNLAWANLARANLAGANLIWAVLARADLTGANLDEADLAGTDLAGANLLGVNLGGNELPRKRSPAEVPITTSRPTAFPASPWSWRKWREPIGATK